MASGALDALPLFGPRQLNGRSDAGRHSFRASGRSLGSPLRTGRGRAIGGKTAGIQQLSCTSVPARGASWERFCEMDGLCCLYPDGMKCDFRLGQRSRKVLPSGPTNVVTC
jgi:hypothetical protein